MIVTITLKEIKAFYAASVTIAKMIGETDLPEEVKSGPKYTAMIQSVESRKIELESMSDEDYLTSFANDVNSQYERGVKATIIQSNVMIEHDEDTTVEVFELVTKTYAGVIPVLGHTLNIVMSLAKMFGSLKGTLKNTLKAAHALYRK